MARFSRSQLIFRAMVVLDDAIEQSKDGPVKPSFGVRLALMILYAFSNGERRCYDGFWQNLQDPLDHQNDHGKRYFRPTQGRSHLRGIARTVGIAFEVDYDRELWIARMSPEERREKRDKDARLAEHRRRLIENGWQYQEQDRLRAEAAAAVEARSETAPGQDDHSPPR